MNNEMRTNLERNIYREYAVTVNSYKELLRDREISVERFLNRIDKAEADMQAELKQLDSNSGI